MGEPTNGSPRWLRVDRGNGIATYIDRSRSRRVDSVHVDVWSSADWEPTPDTATIDRMMSHWLVDCRRLEVVILEMAAYRRGELVEDEPVPADKQDVMPGLPGTRMETVLASACLIAIGRQVDTVP